jgi:medium-chain acyl-[acyl-carrier-protein] hydrolase
MWSPVITTEQQPWFLPLATANRHAPRVLCLPHAGGGSTTFAEVAESLAPDAAVLALNLPGRQARFAEPPRGDLAPLIAEIADQLAAAERQGGLPPYLLFGYCSGALLAFLLARALRERGASAPLALVAASYAAPDLVQVRTDLHTLPADDFWSEILSYGGVPATLLAQPDLREIFEPALRADYELLAGHVHADAPPFAFPITVVRGTRDPVNPSQALAGWSRHTTAAFRVETLPGGHWLLADQAPQVAALLRRELDKAVVGD